MNDLDRDDGKTPEDVDGAGDRIGRLLRATGRRPAVPAERADRVRSAVRARWRADVRRRSWRRRAVWAAGALAAASIVVAVGLGLSQRAGSPPASGIAARVEVVLLSAWSRPASSAASAAPAALRPRDGIAAGSELATGDDGRLAIRMASGHSVRLDAGTHLRVLSDRAIALDRGAVYVDSRGPQGAAEGFVEVRTPFAGIRDVGTQYEARLADGVLRVRVREGRVSLEGPGAPVEVAAGHAVEIGEEGLALPAEEAALAGDWAWIGEVTPLMEIQGRSLREFLDWMARERGLRLRFADPGLSASASGITLEGSIDGMTLDEALESVLPTCGMRHRIEPGALVVEPEAEPSAAS